MEAARIRLVSQRGYAKGLVGAITRLASEGGIGAFYAGYIPILFKQIPYAIGQFTTMELLSDNAWARSVKKKGKAGELGIDLGAGILAGFAAAVLSHPADTLLSKINQGGGGKGGALKKLAVLAKDTGFVGIWAGLGTRMAMTGLLVSGQFLIYGQVKSLLGAPPGVTIAKPETATH